ncbi:MAG: CoA protein activase, partial [Syntrophomonadaceae bacterium]|nr:CoA protein activase [Syntrophomonadaceae bacterium]
MKITFPHMGNMHIAIKTLLEGLRLEVIPPPPISQKTFELGIKNSPEFACMPLKINVGNFIEALENGADTIVMAGGWGPCRFGYYAQVEKEILNDLGYDFDMVILEAPDSKIQELLKQLKAIGQNVTFWEFLKTVKYAWHKLNSVEELEKKLEHILPRTIEKDKAEQIYEQGLKKIDKARDKNEVDWHTKQSLAEMDKLPWHQEKILKIGLIGEIYTILEPSANYKVANYMAGL